MALEAVLLDLDGTVWDSFPWYAGIIADETGCPHEEVLEELRTGGNIIRLLHARGITRNRFVRLLAPQTERLMLFPGSREAIQQFAQRRIPIAAVTSLSGALAEPMMRGTGLHQVIPVTIFAARKPNPEPILTALARLGVEPSSRCIYVGDMRADAECARSAGISFAWASYGYGGDNPDAAAPALAGLKDLLRL